MWTNYVKLLAPTSWTQQLWQAVEPTYQAILDHPFLHGLTDGSLTPDRFAYYVAQDAHYLRDYARALAVVGAKAPTHADTGILARHAVGTSGAGQVRSQKSEDG